MLAGLYDGLSGGRFGRRGAASAVAGLVLLALTLLAAAGSPAPAAGAAKPKRADLTVGSAAARLADGRLTVRITARNLGRRSARASTGAVSWKPAAGKAKAVLLKRFSLHAVSKGGRRTLTVTVALPAGTAAGRFAVSVCLDIRARVRESNGKNNCRSAGTVTVPAAGVSPVTVVSPSPVAPSPSLPGAVPPPVTTPPPVGGGSPPGDTTPLPPGDTTPPDTRITNGPVGLTKERTASIWAESTEAGSSFQCRLDDAAWAPCPPIVNLSAIPDGTHTFEVRAVDGAGNADPTPASRTWSVDGTPPQTTITGPPAGPVNTTAGLPDFTSSESPASFQCRVGNAGAWTQCSPPQQITFPGEGSHMFSVRAYDSAGNVDPTPASRTWTVDLTAPNTSISGGPAGAVAATDATFSLSSSASDQAGFECRLDGGAWEACSSPRQLTGLADGDHTFEARTLDTAGNRDESPESRSWTVDTTAPGTSILTGPSGSVSSASAAFTFTSPEAGVSFECRLDGGAWEACTSPRQLSGLTDGEHTFEVRGIDAALNVEGSPATRIWTVDTTAPETTITSGPADPASSPDASFGFSSADSDVAGFECSLDGAEWVACNSPQQFTGLADGPHELQVRATDGVGHVEPAPAVWAWTIAAAQP